MWSAVCSLDKSMNTVSESSQPPQEQDEVIKMPSRLPGDAITDEVSVERHFGARQGCVIAFKLLTSLCIQPPTPPVASTSSVTSATSASESPIITLTSVSADGTRSRQFHAKYFRPVDSDAPLRAALDLPEAYYSPTASELQTAFAGQVRKREQLVDAPLLTKKLREREEAEKSREKQKRWPQVSAQSLRTDLLPEDCALTEKRGTHRPEYEYVSQTDLNWKGSFHRQTSSYISTNLSGWR